MTARPTADRRLQTDNGLDLLYPLAKVPTIESRRLPHSDFEQLHREVGNWLSQGEEKRAKDHFKEFCKKTFYLSKKDVAGLWELRFNRDFYLMQGHYDQAQDLEDRHGKATTVATQSSRTWAGVGAVTAATGATLAVASGGVLIPVGAVMGLAGGLMGAYGFVVNEMGRVFGDSNSIMRKMEGVWKKRIDNLNKHYNLGLDEQFISSRAREMSIKGVEYHVRKAWYGRGGAAAANLGSSTATNATTVTLGLAATTSDPVTGAVTSAGLAAVAVPTATVAGVRLPAGILSAMGSRLAYMDASVALSVMKSSMEGGSGLEEELHQITAADKRLAADIDETLQYMLAKQLNEELYKELGENKNIRVEDMLRKPRPAPQPELSDSQRELRELQETERAAKKIATTRPPLTGPASSASHAAKIQRFANETTRLRYELDCMHKLQTADDLEKYIELAEETHLQMFEVLQDKLASDQIINSRYTPEEMVGTKKHLVEKFAKAYETFDNARQDEPLKDVKAIIAFNNTVVDILKLFDKDKKIAADPDAPESTWALARRKLGKTRVGIQKTIRDKGVTPIRPHNAVLAAKEAQMLAEMRQEIGPDFIWKHSELKATREGLSYHKVLSATLFRGGGLDSPAGFLLRLFAPPAFSDANQANLANQANPADGRPLTVGDVLKYRLEEGPHRANVDKLLRKIERVEVSESAKLFGQATQRVLRNKVGDPSDEAREYRETFLSNQRAKLK